MIQNSGQALDEDGRPSVIPILTSATFKSSTTKGHWFVKFFSPHCGHCRALAPYWEKAGHKYEPYTKSHDFHLASVDCTVDGDLCGEHKILGYPTLLLYKDGERIDEWLNIGGSDPLVPIAKFIDKYVGGTELESSTTSSSTADLQQTKPTSLASTETGEKVFQDASNMISDTGVTGDAKEDGTSASDSAPAAANKLARPLLSSDFSSNEPQQQIFSNPTGMSVNLTPDTFTKLVTNTHAGWFIKFYAPWCNHCKAMAPAWNELANDFRDKLNIGEVNCDVETRLCKDIKIRGYPTLLFFQGEEHIEYTGLRGLGDLIVFATKAATAGIRDVDAAALETIQKKEEVIFLYFYDSATTSEDLEALQRTSLELIGHAPLLKTSSSILASRFRATTFPKLMVIRDGRPQYYTALGPADMRDHKKILAWMKSAWLPIVPELSAENSHEIMQNRIVVLAALDPESSTFEADRAVLRETAHDYIDQRASEDQSEKQSLRDKKQLKIEEAEKKGDTRAIENAKGIQVKVPDHQEVGFAWVNAVFWKKWLAAAYSINVEKNGRKLVINAEDKKRFWDTDAKGQPIPLSKSAILEVIQIVTSNPSKLASKSTKNSLEAAYYAARRASTGHPYIITCLLISLVAAILLILTRKKSHYRSGSPNGMDREKASGGYHGLGISGTNGNGKFD